MIRQAKWRLDTEGPYAWRREHGNWPVTRSTASLKDVAVLAGVSVKTVSNVVNDFPHVAPPTRARVREAIEQLGYRPNLAARSLRAGRSGLVALAVPELTIPYFAELASLVVEAAAVRGVTVLVEQTAASRERERRFVSGRRPQLVDGLISAPLSLPRAELVRRDDRVPLVLVGESVHDAAVDQIGIDSVRAGRTATEHLLGLGRRRIAAIGAPRGRLRTAAHMRRLRGYREALEVAGIAPDPRLAPEIRATHPTEGDRAMAELLRDNEAPDAVFCFNDLLAIGATRRLLARGLRVPEDVAIVGFDDVAEARYLTPALTTIAPDKAQIATLAVDRVLSRLDGAQVETPRRTEVPFELVVRESTRGREPGA